MLRTGVQQGSWLAIAVLLASGWMPAGTRADQPAAPTEIPATEAEVTPADVTAEPAETSEPAPKPAAE